MSSAAEHATSTGRVFTFRNGLRLASSAIVAYATAYRNVAFAGPAQEPEVGKAPPATYSASYDEGCASAPARTDIRCVVVRMDFLRRIPFDRPVGTMMIGNPAIADATLISTTEAVITAKSVGATNMIFLDEAGAVIADLEIVVQESPERRVVLRRGPGASASYQCSPRCERTLSLSDSTDAHAELTGAIARETDMSSGAAGAGASEPVGESSPITTSTIPNQ